MIKSKPPHLAVWCRVATLPLMRQAHNERMVDIMKTIKLQGIHTPQKAILAAELKPGMVTVWNFGYTSTVKSVEPTKSGKSVKCVIISDESGNEHTRTMRADRLVGVKDEELKNPIDKALSSRQRTYSGIYSDVGTALDTFSTSELAEYYIQRFGGSTLRYFLEQGIISAEISKEKETI